ncbi:MAG: hypothetical protein U5K75_07640 [Ahrensia sp.]|nr:hypothetical protein [Ahrensia sp.]
MSKVIPPPRSPIPAPCIKLVLYPFICSVFVLYRFQQLQKESRDKNKNLFLFLKIKSYRQICAKRLKEGQSKPSETKSKDGD